LENQNSVVLHDLLDFDKIKIRITCRSRVIIRNSFL